MPSARTGTLMPVVVADTVHTLIDVIAREYFDLPAAARVKAARGARPAGCRKSGTAQDTAMIPLVI